jgi:peptide/nickel transport system permease protein
MASTNDPKLAAGALPSAGIAPQPLVEHRRRSRIPSGVLSFVKNKGAIVGAIVMVIWILIALFASVLAPANPLDPVGRSRQPPSSEFLMGTDRLGRDVFSRVLFGSRISLQVGIISVLIGVVVGTTMGLPAAYFRGWIGGLIMRIIDTMLAFPGLLLALVVIASLGPGLTNVMIAVGVGTIPTYARLVRSSCLTIRELDYVAAVQVMGGSSLRIMVKHILPNLIGPVIVLSSLQIGTAILVGSSLSYLGMGAQPPTAEWGLMTSEGRQFMAQAWWLSTFPGLAIFSVVMAVNLIGDGLRSALDPKARKR